MVFGTVRKCTARKATSPGDDHVAGDRADDWRGARGDGESRGEDPSEKEPRPAHEILTDDTELFAQRMIPAVDCIDRVGMLAPV